MAATTVASVCVSTFAVRQQSPAGEDCIDINVTPKHGARITHVSIERVPIRGGRLQIRVEAAPFRVAGRWQRGEARKAMSWQYPPIDGSEESEERGDESPRPRTSIISRLLSIGSESSTPRTSSSSSLFTPSDTEAKSEAGAGLEAKLAVGSEADDDEGLEGERAVVLARDAPPTFAPMPPVNIINRHNNQEKQLTII